MYFCSQRVLKLLQGKVFRVFEPRPLRQYFNPSRNGDYTRRRLRLLCAHERASRVCKPVKQMM
jgi:hypothetical protein